MGRRAQRVRNSQDRTFADKGNETLQQGGKEKKKKKQLALKVNEDRPVLVQLTNWGQNKF